MPTMLSHVSPGLLAILFSFLAAAHSQAAATVPLIVFDSCAKPEWPKEALRKGQQGTVQLEFEIASDGAVSKSRIIGTSFFPLLDEAARAGLSKCRFTPALNDTTQVGTAVKMQYVWTLEGERDPPPLTGAPAHLLPFLKQARAAEALLDPYQRCLAFPDFPGSQWPQGLTKQYCEVAAGKHVTVQDIEKMLASNQLAELDALFRLDLERHFSDDDFSEIIHTDFKFFIVHEDEASAQANRVTSDWIEKAPASPFALAARGLYFQRAAELARGGKWTRDTPKENMRRMSDNISLSTALLERAARLEPRLMPVYSGLISGARMEGERQRVRSAFERGAAVDPGCRELGRSYMNALEPRWGGSHAEMLAFTSRLEPLVAKRPMAALNLVSPLNEMASALENKKEYAKIIALLEPAKGVAPNSELFNYLGTSLQYTDGDNWDSLARLMVAYRYNDNDLNAAEARGRLLLDVANDPGWAIASLKKAVALSPTHLRAHYVLGRAYMALSEFDQAETAFTTASASPDWKHEAWYGLIEVAFMKNQIGEVGKLSDAFIAGFPEQPRGYFMRGVAHARAGQEAGATAAFKTFVKKAAEQDGNGNPDQIAMAKRYIAGIREPELVGQKKSSRAP